MRYSHFRKFPQADSFRAELSRRDRNRVKRWLDSDAGAKATVPLQTNVVTRLAAWEKSNGFDGPQDGQKNVPKEIAGELKDLVAEMDAIALAQIKLAVKAIRKEDRLAERKTTSS